MKGLEKGEIASMQRKRLQNLTTKFYSSAIRLTLAFLLSSSRGSNQYVLKGSYPFNSFGNSTCEH